MEDMTVTEVTPGGQAAMLGVCVGSVVLKVGGVKVGNQFELSSVFALKPRPVAIEFTKVPFVKRLREGLLWRLSGGAGGSKWKQKRLVGNACGILECHSLSEKAAAKAAKGGKGHCERLDLTAMPTAEEGCAQETDALFRAKHKKTLACINYSFAVQLQRGKPAGPRLVLCAETKEDLRGWLAYFRTYCGLPTAEDADEGEGAPPAEEEGGAGAGGE